MTRRIAIVGAGLSGLSLAYRLQQRLPDASIRVLETASRPGGTAWTVDRDGFQVELGPNGFLDNKPTMLQLVRDLGLNDRLVEASPSAGTNRYLYLGQRLERLPSGPGDLLRTPLLSWRGKLAFLAERFRRGRTDDGDESIDAFARRRAGGEAADVFADAMVTGIYAGDPRLLSLPACFPRVAAMEREFGSVLKGFAKTAKRRRAEAVARGEPHQRTGKLWSLQGGIRSLVTGLAVALKQPPILGVRIRSLEKTGDPARPTWRIQAEGNDVWDADGVALTCPSHQSAEIARSVDGSLSRELADIPFNRIAVVALGYREGDVPGGVDGFGFIVPQRLKRDLLGAQWCSSIYPGRAPAGTILLRAMCGGWTRGDMVDWPYDQLLNAGRAELRVIQGITATPIFHLIQRWSPGIPQYHLGHLDRLGRIDSLLAGHPGLYLGGNSLRGVAMNDCAEQATILAERIARS